MKLAQAERLAARIEKTLAPYSDFILVVGSVRRKAQTVGDIELVVLPKDLEEFLKILEEEGFRGGTRKQVGAVRGMPVEIYLAHDPKEIGGLVFMYTGDFTFNIAMRRKAKRRGLKLNQYGIWKGAKPVLQSDDEVDFFEFLDVRYHEPEERSLATRGKAKKAKMGDGSDRFWDDEEE
jgi:DNA polymerase (family X)